MDKQDLKKLCDWYNINTDTSVPIELFIYIIDKVFNSESYTISDLNDLLLIKYNDEYLVDGNGKFIVRESRKNFIKKINSKQEPRQEAKKIVIPTISEEKKQKVPKFKLSELGDGKIRFIKLQ